MARVCVVFLLNTLIFNFISRNQKEEKILLFVYKKFEQQIEVGADLKNLNYFRTVKL